MKKLLTLTLSLIFALNLASAVSAGNFDWQIKARKASMTLRAFNLGILGAMAKGDMKYDADKANVAAGNLAALANMNESAMWPQKSDMTANPGITRAKLEIWTTFPKIGESSKAFKDSAAKMAAAAGSGIDGIRANIRANSGV
ncbi:unnamed protein product, partial [marine sediment metagenome]